MSSGSEPLGGVARLYSESLAEHGPGSPKSVGWKDEAEQRLRFERLLEAVEPGDDSLVVADLGCGYGAMFDFLAERLGARLERYVGYEISPDMLAAARERLTDPRVSLVSGDRPTDEADYSFASGTFNVKLDAADTDWEAYVLDTLRDLARLSRRGLAFNLLTSHVDWRRDHLFYADPARFFDFCRRELSRFVTLLDDYPLYEWTMLVRFER